MRYARHALAAVLTVAVIAVCGALPWIAGLIDDRSQGPRTEPVREMRLEVKTDGLDVLDKLAMLCQAGDEGYLIEGSVLDNEEQAEAEAMAGEILEELDRLDLLYASENSKEIDESVRFTKSLKLIIGSDGTAGSFMFYTVTVSAGRTMLNMQIDRDTGALLSSSFMPAKLREENDNAGRMTELRDWFVQRIGAPNGVLSLSGTGEAPSEDSHVYVHDDPYTGYMSWVSEDYGRCTYEFEFRNGIFSIGPLTGAAGSEAGQLNLYETRENPESEE